MAKNAEPSLAELETMLETRREAISALEEEREKLSSRIAEIDQEIADMAGKKSPGRPKGSTNRKKKKSVKVKRKKGAAGGRRARNKKSLKDYLTDILEGSKKGYTLNELMEEVQKAGYKSKSADFKTVLYQTLYHLKRDGKVDRDEKTGAYVLK